MMAMSIDSSANPNQKRAPTYVLIVDDDPDFLQLLISEIGAISGVEIDVAQGPSEALECLTHRDYELVVSDWALERSTGPEVLTQADGMIPGNGTADFPYKTPVLF